MERRQYLKVAGGAGVAAVGGYGLYTTMFREADWRPGNRGGADWDEDFEAEPRDGWMLLGVGPSERGVETLDPFEAWLDKRHAVVGKFVDIGASEREIERIVYSLLETTWGRGQVPHLWWQPFIPDRDSTSRNINRHIARGDHDDVIETWAKTLSEWAIVDDGPDRRVYLNLAPEMNGDWSPWGAGGAEEDFVDMWRRVHDQVMAYGLDDSHVQWIWALDNTNVDADQEALYPGDDYVDWVGVHGFNWVEWEPWQSAAELYGPTIDLLRSITDHPLAVTEFGSSSETGDGHDPARKDEWIADAYAFFKRADVRMTLWFNNDKETDWAVFNAERGVQDVTVDGRSYDVYPAYRSAVTDDGVLGPYPDHPRVLTDEEFAGEF